MANIMITEACNLRCPYCFAGEFVNKAPKEITLIDFVTALDFVLGDGTECQVGIIGGEPMIHSHINELMHTAVNDPRSQLVVLYTNAVLLERLDTEILEHPKLRMLINCNSPEDMGEQAFERMRQNLLHIKNAHESEERFSIGVNVYKPDFDYSYLFPLLTESKFKVVRLSVSVPMKGNIFEKMPLEYFSEMKDVSIRFINDMLLRGIPTILDCNYIPMCVFTPLERRQLMEAKNIMRQANSGKYPSLFWNCAVYTEHTNCSPVIDILPNLQAIRCFGLSGCTKRDIRDYGGISELKRYYVQTVDLPARNVWTDDACAGCGRRMNGQCSCGCLLFKSEQLEL